MAKFVFCNMLSPTSLSLSHSQHFMSPHFSSKIQLHWRTCFMQGLNKFPKVSISPHSFPDNNSSTTSLPFVTPLEAIFFDIDGTLCDSDPIHYDAFRVMLQEVNFNGGIPITEKFFIEKISGKHNEDLRLILLPDWDIQKARKFMEEKEALFRRLASEQLEPMKGLDKLNKWIEENGIKRAAVTNAPRPNAELLISMLRLSDFFEVVIIGNECDRAKPFPDPYLKALQVLKVSHKHSFVFEDSVSGVKAGLAAGMPVIGICRRNPAKLLLEAGASLVIEDFDDPRLWRVLEEVEREKQASVAFK